MNPSPLDAIPTRPEVRDAIRRFLAEAQAAVGDRMGAVVLYGSTARGDARPDSDVDLLVIWNGGILEALDLLVPITSRILLESGVDISVHPRSASDMEHLRSIGSAFAQNLDREGVVVAA